MCGLVGFFGEPSKVGAEAFEAILCTSVIRGWDSTGVAFFNKEGSRIVKDTVFPWRLMKSKTYQEWFGKDNYLLLGHNRAATKGSVSIANAHPFRYKHITLIHNGTLNTHITHSKKKTETDSEGIAIGIAERGIEAVWAELDGDASLVFFDSNERKLSLISNGKRPLVWGYSPDLKGMFIASESRFIRSIQEQMGFKILKDDFWSPKDNDLWSFTLDSNWKIKESSKHLKHFVPSNKRSEAFKINGKMGYWDRERNIFVEMNEDPFTGDITPLVEAEEKTLPLHLKTDATSSNSHQGVGNRGGLRRQIRNKNVSKTDFEKNLFWKQCYFCDEPLDYSTCTIASDDVAACPSCSMTADDNNIRLEGLRGA